MKCGCTDLVPVHGLGFIKDIITSGRLLVRQVRKELTGLIIIMILKMDLAVPAKRILILDSLISGTVKVLMERMGTVVGIGSRVEIHL